MTTTLLDIPAPTHREITPPRQCESCGCYLRSTNETRYCSPCVTPAVEIVEEDIWGEMEAADLLTRRRAGMALAELMA